jgi:hypothetical protein
MTNAAGIAAANQYFPLRVDSRAFFGVYAFCG